jgi:hypothetical protein
MTMDYTTEYGQHGGRRFDVRNPPAPGTKLVKIDGSVVTFDGIGMAGMLECTDCTGFQSLLFPQQIAGPFVAAQTLDDADLSHL